jgi:hypothetical protein
MADQPEVPNIPIKDEAAAAAEFRARSRQLAADVLEVLDAPEDPDRARRDAEKEAADREAYEAFYLRTGQTTGVRSASKEPRARTITEMQFAISLEPCPHCGTIDPPDARPRLDLFGAGEVWQVDLPCATCGKRRSRFETVWPGESGTPTCGSPPSEIG